MANIKSAKKDIRKTARRTAKNKVMKNAFDKVNKDIKLRGIDKLNEAYSIIDKMESRGILKRNTAARKKSKLAQISKKK